MIQLNTKTKNEVMDEDFKQIISSLTDNEKLKFSGSTFLITGCAGFLGFYFVNFLTKNRLELGINKIICLDNFILGRPDWLSSIDAEGFEIHDFDISKDDLGTISSSNKTNYVMHLASIASPIFYRKYPIQTLDANIWGLRSLLDYYRESTSLRGLLFFSSSEIYGDPHVDYVPTPETYWGNVNTLGPRSCYDESKRFGETMCYLYAQQYALPIRIVRPFNNYGPGMKIDDSRAPADFAKSILSNTDINLHSDGSPSRTFCYISDAITGYFKALFHGTFDVFNIGKASPEVTVRDLAKTFQMVGRENFGYECQLVFTKHEDVEYLVNNPQRRCPVTDKASEKLGFNANVSLEDGINRYLNFLAAKE